jgi:hypothetical protein
MKTMIKAYQPINGMTAHIVITTSKVNEMLECLNAVNAEVKTFAICEMPFNELPEEVQDQVKQTLKVFANANVVFEYNRFEVSAHTCIKAKYNYDHFVCGRYSAKEIFTEEERKQHLAELNSYEFPEWAW